MKNYDIYFAGQKVGTTNDKQIAMRNNKRNSLLFLNENEYIVYYKWQGEVYLRNMYSKISFDVGRKYASLVKIGEKLNVTFG